MKTIMLFLALATSVLGRSVEGTVFYVTHDSQNIRLALVTVRLVERRDLEREIFKLSEVANEAHQGGVQSFDKEPIRIKASDLYDTLPTIATTRTGPEGQFKLTIPKSARDPVIIASDTRRFGDVVENLRWVLGETEWTDPLYLSNHNQADPLAWVISIHLADLERPLDPHTLIGQSCSTVIKTLGKPRARTDTKWVYPNLIVCFDDERVSTVSVTK